MMASRGLTICGSGTVSTRTSCFPCQVSARMDSPRRAGVGERRLGGRDLAGLHELLEAAQFVARLNLRLAPEDLREQLCRACPAGGS